MMAEGWPEAEAALRELESIQDGSLTDASTRELHKRATSRLYELAQQNPDKASHLLEQLFASNSCAARPGTCGAIAAGLASVKHESAVRILAAMLRSSQTTALHEDLAEELGEMGGTAGVPALVDALKHQEAWVRAKAARSLGQIGSDAAGAALIDALRDEAEHVRLAAVRALGRIAPVEGIEPLKATAENDDDEDVREAAADALKILRR